MVIVAPLSVIEKVCQQGIKPLRADMEQVEAPPKGVWTLDEYVLAAGRWYRFRSFSRIMRLELVTEPVEPVE
jgi:hypothetical protein